MRKDEDLDQPNTDEDSIAKMLQLVGRRPSLPVSTKEIWSRRFAAELNPVVDKRSRLRKWMGGVCALCASLLLFYFAPLSLLPNFLIGDAPIGQVSKGVGDIWSYASPGESRRAAAGLALFPGTEISTAANSLVALRLQGVDVRLNENTRAKMFRNKVRLIKGELYIDSGWAGIPGQSFQVSTPLATVKDIGTQFTVSYSATGVTTAVREGTIIVALEEGEYRANAHQDYAQRIHISKGNQVEITKAKKNGEHWDWGVALAETFAIEGRSAFQFLQWATRETGLTLVFADKAAEDNAQSTILHGDISAFTPHQAIDIVLATTALKAQRIDNNTLKVALVLGE